MDNQRPKAASAYFHFFTRPSSASLANNTLQNGLSSEVLLWFGMCKV